VSDLRVSDCIAIVVFWCVTSVRVRVVLTVFISSFGAFITITTVRKLPHFSKCPVIPIA
jgi:hypothetical protein